MKRIALLALCAAPIVAWCEDLTNTVVTVDQRGNLNVEGIASVEDVATNAVKVQIAEAKAAAAQQTAQGVTAALQATVDNIMSNNVIIYRSGFSDSFAALVIITENDKFAMAEARWIEKSAAQIVVDIDYVSTADLGLTKPAVHWHDTLEGGRSGAGGVKRVYSRLSFRGAGIRRPDVRGLLHHPGDDPEPFLVQLMFHLAGRRRRHAKRGRRDARPSERRDGRRDGHVYVGRQGAGLPGRSSAGGARCRLTR